MQKGASVNVENSAGVTPLHIAAQNNNTLKCLKELLKSGSVNIDAKTCYGDTPVAYSCQTNSDKILKMLIKHGANVNFSNFQKSTPLHIACWNGCIDTVTLLIEAGANVNAKNELNWTPLYQAASHGGVEVCKYLLEHGADANLPNHEGLLPLHFGARVCTDVYSLIRKNTKNDVILKYCTFPGPHGIDMGTRSLLCIAFSSLNKSLIERILKSQLPSDVLNCPVAVKQSSYSKNHFINSGLLESFNERLILLTPLCFFLNNIFLEIAQQENYASAFCVLKMLIHNKISMNSKFNSTDYMYVMGPIELTLCSHHLQEVQFNIINMLLKSGQDPDKECGYMPIELFKICLTSIPNKGGEFMLLLKASNVIEPEDILKWIIENRSREFIQCPDIQKVDYLKQEMVYALLVLSPYVTVQPSVCDYFLTLHVEQKHMAQKIKQICEHPLRPLASYCRTIIRRQLHCETKNNYWQFKKKLNLLPLPKTIISYLKFSEIQFINKSMRGRLNKLRIDFQITCDKRNYVHV